MDQISQQIVELTGAVSNLIGQIKGLERRIQVVEEKATVPGPSVGALGNNQIFELSPPQTEAELKEISKLPDCVKELQVFNGNPTQYVSWIHAVEGILKDYDIVKTKPLYRAILQHIRGKIRGPADAALISYNIFDGDWLEMKTCLSLHYADKRDLRTLEHQLNQLAQKGTKLDEFYAAVNHQLSLMVNKIKTESYSEETVKALVETYRNRALDVFVRGLNGDISKMLMIQRPRTLPEAYSACLEIQNLNYRNNSIHSSSFSNTITAPVNQSFRCLEHKPYLPPRRPQQSFTGRNNRFMPSSRQESVAPPKTGPKPLEKMEVDRTVQSRQVNYVNRPKFENNPFKRRANSDNFQNKQQRLYNIEAEDDGDLEEYHACAEDATSEEINFMTGGHPAYHT